jgi:hypothetical protein
MALFTAEEYKPLPPGLAREHFGLGGEGGGTWAS